MVQGTMESIRKERKRSTEERICRRVLSSEQNTERLREDENNNSKDGEDDKLPCVVDKSEVIRPHRHTIYYQHMKNTFLMHIKQAAHTAFSIKK